MYYFLFLSKWQNSRARNLKMFLPQGLQSYTKVLSCLLFITIQSNWLYFQIIRKIKSGGNGRKVCIYIWSQMQKSISIFYNLITIHTAFSKENVCNFEIVPDIMKESVTQCLFTLYKYIHLCENSAMPKPREFVFYIYF